ncbi:MAG: NAD(P)-binding domain-containing protein [Methanoregula sp.]|uniref:NAD(P)-dependent oxidoreductase n=1 Tax=Methanoregula sp. TaxID=2052170 RepID=UPI0025F89C9C|nr:NAD(P)-dependent oxidoreductase [Methanoregula sp.]MCK9631765.1 NAD(P)-binding domain-containing protein [Methanoregula sp.]
MKRVIYLGSPEGYEASYEILHDIADVKHITADAGAFSSALPYADAVLDASMKVHITDTMIASAPKLQIISCATTGSDHIDRSEITRRGISVRTLKEDPELLQNITPAAELSWALLLACARRLPAAISHVSEGKWVREEFPGIMLRGRRLGLIGCGRIGGWMSRYARAFGMDVIGYDPYLTEWPDTIQPASLESVMETSDFISIHVHLGSETEGLVSRALLERIKPGAIVINTSRGPIVDEIALLDGLRSGRIHGAGLDVLTGEPDIENHPLVLYSREHDNILITPHCGGFSPDSVRFVCSHAAKKIRETLLNGESC